MSNINEASSFHKQAATEHQEAARHHLKAAECHGQNKAIDAKGGSKSAMECCNKAQKQSTRTCAHTAK